MHVAANFLVAESNVAHLGKTKKVVYTLLYMFAGRNGGTTMHNEHRKRMRERFRLEGLEGFAPHNKLELLLFFSIPRMDTNEIAHRLIDTFGSFEAVLDASYEDLLRVQGVGENSATLLTLLPQLARVYMSAKESDGVQLENADKIKRYFLSKYIGCKHEILYMLCLDGRGKLQNCCELAEGTMNGANLDTRYLLELAFRNNAASVVLAHNHPNGVAAPSYADVEATRRVVALMSSVDIRVVDHIIVAQAEAFSMAQNQKFAGLFL